MPRLPDDLMMMIFRVLKTTERIPLATACKRFRELDFEIGRMNFRDVFLSWVWWFMCNFQNVHIPTFLRIINRSLPPMLPPSLDPSFGTWITQSHTAMLTHFTRTIITEEYSGNRIQTNLWLMWEITTNGIPLKLDLLQCTRNEFDQNECAILSTILKSLRYKCLKVKFDGERDFSETCVLSFHCFRSRTDYFSFIHTLIRNRDLQNARVYLSWERAHPSNLDLSKIRELLMGLPCIDKLDLQWHYPTVFVPSMSVKRLMQFSEWVGWLAHMLCEWRSASSHLLYGEIRKFVLDWLHC